MGRKTGTYWLFIAFLVVLMVPILVIGRIFKLKDESGNMNKKKLSNIIGLVVLATIVLAIVASRGVRWINETNKAQATELQLNRVAQSFAQKNDDDIMKWASGEIKDAWGNSPVLHSNNSTDGIQFYSKGPDGKLGTEDDLKSRVFYPEKETLPESLLKPMPQDSKSNKESLPDRFRRGIDRAKQKLDSSEIEAKEEKKGWSFRFRWGKGEE